MILGLTGVIGGGKSAALRELASAGAETYDVDRLCHDLYRDTDSSLVQSLLSRWGGRILTAEGSVDRRAIASIVFADRAELDFLNSLMHPELKRRVAAQIGSARARAAAAVWEVPLLFELRWERMFDATVAVWTEPGLRRERLRARGMSDEEIRVRESRQWTDERKLELADYALINNGPADCLRTQCGELLKYFNRRKCESPWQSNP